MPKEKTYHMHLDIFLSITDKILSKCKKKLLFINDGENINSLKFHITSDDYFGTLATIVSLLQQDVKLKKKHKKTLEKIQEDLMYLQNNYKITTKS